MKKAALIFNENSLLLLLCLSYALGIYLFFYNPWFESLFLNHELEDLNNYPYLEFAQNFFKRNYYENIEHWWTESLLFPFLTRVFGASRSIFAFKIFASILTISFLPIIAIGYLKVSKNIFQSFALLALLTVVYGGAYDYQVVFPDSLLVIFLGLAAIQKNILSLFVFIFLAGLTHFSITFFSSISLVFLFYSSPVPLRASKYKYVLSIILSLMLSWLSIQLWLQFMNVPEHNGRLAWAANSGLGYFNERYIKNPLGFWLVPKYLLLLSFAGINLYFLYIKKLIFVSTSLISLLIAYFCQFFTIDGYRVFITVFCGPYIFLIVSFIQTLFTNKLRLFIKQPPLDLIRQQQSH